MIKTTALFHDMSCFGRCALSVIVPVISVLKIQPVTFPTALLSTHTGGFTDYTFLDLTSEIKKIIAHYEKLNLMPDCVYTGFLGSLEQIEIISDYIKEQKKRGAYIFVDPVMADDGKLYSSYTEDMKRGMIKLAVTADIITPNITEAFFLLDMDYSPPPYSQELIGEIMRKLFELCEYNIKKIVITSVDITNKGYGVVFGENANNDNNDICTGGLFTPQRRKNYPGSGDIFSAVLCGLLLNGTSLHESIGIAMNFLNKIIDYTMDAGTPVREGLIFEPFLDSIVNKKKEENCN
jgi:pyridoxine kinase